MAEPQKGIDIDYAGLLAKAVKAAEVSYSPYSHYRVGAAILTADGEIFTGTNVENSYIGCSICAERTAAVKAVSSGARQFLACAVANPTDDECVPCGICRQFLAEFGKDQLIIVKKGQDGHIAMPLSELLPEPG